MSMTQGTCTVAEDGTVTKSGAAGAVYDALLADFLARKFPSTGPDGKPTKSGMSIPAGAAGVQIKEGLAAQARAIAAIIPYITANAEVAVTIVHTSPDGAGLQYVPSSVTGGVAVPCDPPSADRHLAGTVS
jgi:hypothetical protein